MRVEADGALVDLPAVEVIAAVKELDRPLMVLAPDGRAAEDFRQEHGLPRRRTIYATVRSVRGWTAPEIVVLPGFHGRHDAERVWESLWPCLLIRRPDARPERPYSRWAGTEPQEVDPELDDLTRAQLAEIGGAPAAVARVHDQWLRAHHGILGSSGHWAGDFLDLLAAEGYQVVPIEVPEFAAVLPASPG